MTQARRTTWTCRPDSQVPQDAERLLTTVPEWFGLPEANTDYIEAARTKETWTVRGDDGGIIGLTLVDQHFPHVVELHLMVVDRAHHGQGVGTVMVQAVEEDARARGVRLLEVKTLGASQPPPTPGPATSTSAAASSRWRRRTSGARGTPA